MEPTQRRDPEDARVGGEAAEAIGSYLARQRKLRGVSLDELADATRIPVRSLERLESGAFDRAPDGFARGFVRTVALALGLPPDETVARMLPEATGDEQARGRRQLPSGRSFAIAGALVLASFGLLVWQGAHFLPAGWTRDRDTTLVRRDAIKALADEVAAIERARDAAP
jgi:cytoskeletal protein RodZ